MPIPSFFVQTDSRNTRLPNSLSSSRTMHHRVLFVNQTRILPSPWRFHIAWTCSQEFSGIGERSPLRLSRRRYHKAYSSGELGLSTRMVSSADQRFLAITR